MSEPWDEMVSLSNWPEGRRGGHTASLWRRWMSPGTRRVRGVVKGAQWPVITRTWPGVAGGVMGAAGLAAYVLSCLLWNHGKGAGLCYLGATWMSTSILLLFASSEIIRRETYRG